MKLISNLKPRLDGTVVLATASGELTFSANARGDLEGEVPDDEALAALDTGNFHPATEDDEKSALALRKAQKAKAKKAKGQEEDQGGAQDDDDLDDDLAHDPNAAPVEGAAAPAAAKRAAAKTAAPAAAK